MANIQKRTTKDGKTTYRIRVYAGEAQDGKKILKSMTYCPADGMTVRQIEKAVQKAAMEFERQVQQGGLVADSMTVDELFEKWFKEYAEPQLKPHTVSDYRKLVPRISAALGHIKLNKLRPGHIMQFYAQLQKSGIRLDGKYKANLAFIALYPKGKRKALVQAAGIAESTATRIWAGERTNLQTAQKLAQAAGVPFSKAFTNVSKDEKLSGNSARHYHRLLSSVFNTAVRWQLMQENPCARVDSPKVETPDVQYLDESGIAKLLAVLPDAPTQYSVIVQLALFTGCRRGELCGLRWSDIDLSAGLLAVNRTLEPVDGKGLLFSTPKTKKSRRVIKLDDNAVQLLRDYRKWQLSERLRIGSKWARKVCILGETVDNDLLFTKWDGQPIDPNSVTSWFPRFLRDHDLQPVRFHSLRHSNAALLIAAHVPVTTVAGRLGHAQVSTTTNIYAGFIRSSDAKAADALGEAVTRILDAEIG